MGMRIVWGLYDNETSTLICLFENQPLLEGYREILLRKWWEDMTKPVPEDVLPGDQNTTLLAAATLREALLTKGYDTWRNDEVYSNYPRYQTQKYELWNSVPPNVERLVVHFDS